MKRILQMLGIWCALFILFPCLHSKVLMWLTVIASALCFVALLRWVEGRTDDRPTA